MLKFKIINLIFLVIILLVFCAGFLINVSKVSYFFILMFWLILTAIGSFNILWNYHLNALNSNPNVTSKKIAITFDDGPNPIYTPKVLQLLKKFNSKASFFCIGKNVEQNSSLIREIVGDGHIIGNHSFNHSNYFGFYNTIKVIDELVKTDSCIEGVIGKRPILFRPPFGVTNPSIKKALADTGHYVVGWNMRSLDTVLKNEKKILQRITKNLKPGDIILLHDTNDKTINVLEQLLIFLEKNKFETVTVDNLLKINAYA